MSSTQQGSFYHNGSRLSQFLSGEKLNEDGWIYKNKKQVRKWFQHRNNWNYFWSPVLKEIPRIEKLYCRLLDQQNKLWKLTSEKIKEITNTEPFLDVHGHKVWLAHAKPKFNINSRSEDYGYHLYTFSNDSGYGISWSYDWVKKPDYPISLKLGQQFYELRNLRNNRIRCAHIAELLDDAICKHIKENMAAPATSFGTKLYDIVINNNHYRYLGESKVHGQFLIKKIAWPDVEFETCTLTDGEKNVT